MSDAISPNLALLMNAAATASVIAVRAGRSAEVIDFAARAHGLQRRNHLYLNTLGVAHGEAALTGTGVALF